MPLGRAWPACVPRILLVIAFVIVLYCDRRHKSASVSAVQVTDSREGGSHSHVFERAFYINANDSPHRRQFMERQLVQAGVRFERWPALRGSPELLKSHAHYFQRGVERHLYLNRSGDGGEIGAWGTIGTYLSHLLLFERILERYGANTSTTFLILQDDTQLNPNWLPQLANEVQTLSARSQDRWARLLLVWWGLSRPQDCRGSRICVVRPPAGPTEPGQADCCGKRFYHGLQAWLVRSHGLRCLVRRLKRRRIKNIDAQMVQCACPRTYALPKGRMLGRHLDKALGSERAAVNSVWRAHLQHGNQSLKASAHRNLRKTHLQHLLPAERARSPS